jgi:hypothetical protein
LAAWFGKGGSTPLDPDPVPPPALALRGGDSAATIPQNANFANLLGVGASLGTNKIGVWGLRPQRVQGRALAFPVALGSVTPAISRLRKAAA